MSDQNITITLCQYYSDLLDYLVQKNGGRKEDYIQDALMEYYTEERVEMYKKSQKDGDA